MRHTEVHAVEPAQILLSLRGVDAKVWIDETEVDDQLSGASSIKYEFWERNSVDGGQGLRAPVGTLIEFKRAWLDTDGIERRDPDKARRSLNLVLVHQGPQTEETHQFDGRINHGVSAWSQIVRSEVPTRGRPRPKENWCLWILCASSIPAIVTAALANDLKPRMGPHLCLIAR